MISINGRVFSGNSINIRDGQVFIDGQPADIGEIRSQTLTVLVQGDALNVTADGNVTVSGHVHGSVSAGGNVNCESVGGTVNSGGNTSCGRVAGNINAGGNVRHA